jgi:YidC/Oxa1 family membrane protein insertase
MPGDVWRNFFTGGWPVVGVVLIPFISAALSFIQSKVSMSGNASAQGNDPTARTSRMMIWMMPLMSVWICFTLPAALGVYWIVNSLLYAVQEKVLTRYYKSHMDDEISEKERQKREDRLRRMEAAREQQRRYAAEEAEKKSLKEKRAEKQAAKSNKKKNTTNENGRVGDRPYARGRSFDAEHYGE